mgnify:CR=1 FL=1
MLKIRKAACSDGAAIERINKETLGYEFSETAASLKSILQNPDHILFAAELDGRVIGYIHGADYSTTYSRPLKNILTLAVLPDVQGEGGGGRFCPRWKTGRRPKAPRGCGWCPEQTGQRPTAFIFTWVILCEKSRKIL